MQCDDYVQQSLLCALLNLAWKVIDCIVKTVDIAFVAKTQRELKINKGYYILTFPHTTLNNEMDLKSFLQF